MRFRFIAEQRLFYSVTLLCRVMGVSRSGFYGYLSRVHTGPSRREQHDAALLKQISAIFEESNRRYGSPRIHIERAKPAPLGLVHCTAA